jgi:hypothetical protein
MPAVSYYLGRPARFWIAVMSGAARATVANPAAAAFLARRQPAAPAEWRRTPEEPSAPAATATGSSYDRKAAPIPPADGSTRIGRR